MMGAMTSPQCSIMLRTFAAEDPGGWDHVHRPRPGRPTTPAIDRVVLSDHVVFGENLEAYGDPKRGGARGGKQPTGPDGHWLDPVATIAYLSALTTRVRFGTNILIAALRRPVTLGEGARDHRRALRRAHRPRGRRRLAGGGVRGRRACRTRSGAACSTTPSRCASCLWREQSAAYDGEGLTFARHPPDAQAAPARWRAGLGERHGQPPLDAAPRPLRLRLDPVGRRRGRRRRRHRQDAGRGRRASAATRRISGWSATHRW